MKINLPEGFQMPENVREGESFEAVATITPSEDGSFIVTAIDGAELPEYSSDGKEKSKKEKPAEEEPVEEEMENPEIVLPFE